MLLVGCRRAVAWRISVVNDTPIIHALPLSIKRKSVSVPRQLVTFRRVRGVKVKLNEPFRRVRGMKVKRCPGASALDQEVRVVVLHRVVRNPEAGTVPARAQRLPEGAHEAPPAQRRHVVEHAQRDQHRAAPGDGAAAAVRHPRAARARTSGAGPGSATAGGLEIEAGLPGSAASSDLPRLPLSGVRGTTFHLHEASPWWVLHSGSRLLKNTVYVNSILVHCRRSPRSWGPAPEHGPFHIGPVPTSNVTFLHAYSERGDVLSEPCRLNRDDDAEGVVHALSIAPVLRYLARLGKGWATPHRR